MSLAYIATTDIKAIEDVLPEGFSIVKEEPGGHYITCNNKCVAYIDCTISGKSLCISHSLNFFYLGRLLIEIIILRIQEIYNVLYTHDVDKPEMKYDYQSIIEYTRFFEVYRALSNIVN